MDAIVTKGLRKEFGEKVAVVGLDLTIREDEVFAILGPNGAGKTTTIKMLCCLTSPTAGDAEVYGHSVVNASDDVKQLINISPQETAVAPNLTVRENLELVATLYGYDKAEVKARADEMMKFFKLSDRANDRAKKLSGGLQRRLSIALAIISEPKILFLDEPTLGLDVRARRDLWKIIEELKVKMTVILTTHYLEEVEALADRVMIMSKGAIKALGTVAELKAQTN